MKGTTGRTVVVTGASAGVGRAIARAFAREGARIALLARNPERLETARGEVEELGGLGIAIVCDVSDPEQVEQAARQVEEQWGPIDVWVNNAMTSVFSPLKEMSPEEVRRVTEVTYLGAAYGTMTALRRMLPLNRGHIIQVGSALSDRSIPLQSAYCGAKHGVRGFTDSLRCELIHDRSKVRITMVQLPAMNTPQFEWVKSRLPNKPQPVPPIFQPEVAAEAVVWASHHNRREIYVGLPTVEAMWGNKFVRGLLDWYLGRTGYQAQQTDQLETPERPSNLWESVPGPFSARGRFDDRAQGSSLQLRLVQQKWNLAAIAAAGAAFAAVLAIRRGRN